MTATLADLLDASPLARRIADTALRYAADLAIDSADWPLMAAARILADPTLADALMAADLIAALRERHHPVGKWAEDSDVTKCSCGRGSCVDEEMLR